MTFLSLKEKKIEEAREREDTMYKEPQHFNLKNENEKSEIH